jgi:ATP-dependent helicase/nuclease subunit B
MTTPKKDVKAARRDKAVYTIPPGVSFIDALADGLLARAHSPTGSHHQPAPPPGHPVGSYPVGGSGGERAETDSTHIELSHFTILLPTRRSLLALRDAFIRAHAGRPLLLPRMIPVGDIDEDEVELAEGKDPFPEAGPDILPAISTARRRLLLAQLVSRHGSANGLGPFSPARALRLADELARLLDRVQTQRLSFDRLAQLVSEDFAEHWQITIDFLKIIAEHWPAILADEGCIDPAERRYRLLAARAERWRAHPPDYPVIAAGSTGSIPATADLLAVVAELPQGEVILPALDCSLDPQSWARIDDTHPQASLKRLLEKLELTPAQVRDWRETGTRSPPTPRETLLSEVMRPARTTDHWQGLQIDKSAIKGLRGIDCATPQQEAGVIALLLRESLEEKDRTAALVTFDRALARRVAAELRRFRIDIDDSAGRPLATTPLGVFLRLIARLAEERAAPVPLLALFKHPFAAGGLKAAKFRQHTQQLERLLLRAPRPAQGFGGLRKGLQAISEEGKAAKEAYELDCWLSGIEEAARPFFEGVNKRKVALKFLLEEHIRLAEFLAGDAETAGKSRLWEGEAGEVAADLIAHLLQAADDFPPIDGAAWPALFEAWIEGAVVRPRHGGHPRLAILGPLEARLQHADRMILGGLNEGVWPPQPAIDPWMSRPLRARFGLPSPEQRIGLSAHDFAQAFAAPEVALTRSTKVGGVPTVESRWLSRLHAVIAGSGLDGLDHGPEWIAHWARIDRAESVAPCPRPAPRPPVHLRPRRLSVTEVETWIRNPYAIYARHILKLRALDPIDADPGAADRGILIHRSLEAFTTKYPQALPDNALIELTGIGERLFKPLRTRPGAFAIWWPRFLRLAKWFIAVEMKRRGDLLEIFSETRGKLTIEAPAGPFVLTAKADRIERHHDGSLTIIDYKTGSAPSGKAVKQGLSPQLPLEAAIAEAGGFKDIDPATVNELAYWILKGGDPQSDDIKKIKDADSLALAAREGISRLIIAFDDEATAYPAHPRAQFDDYRHLARVMEWSSAGGEAE